ncbi:MAG: hypothetical protein ACPGPE_05180 [Planctomycetota bacterium]
MPDIDETPAVRRSFSLTPLQAYTFLVACMSVPGDTLVKLGVFCSYQEVIDLLQWSEEYAEIPEEVKQHLYQMFTLPGDELPTTIQIEGIEDPFV